MSYCSLLADSVSVLCLAVANNIVPLLHIMSSNPTSVCALLSLTYMLTSISCIWTWLHWGFVLQCFHCTILLVICLVHNVCTLLRQAPHEELGHTTTFSVWTCTTLITACMLVVILYYMCTWEQVTTVDSIPLLLLLSIYCLLNFDNQRHHQPPKLNRLQLERNHWR